jgi:hypothetical protein
MGGISEPPFSEALWELTPEAGSLMMAERGEEQPENPCSEGQPEPSVSSAEFSSGTGSTKLTEMTQGSSPTFASYTDICEALLWVLDLREHPSS